MKALPPRPRDLSVLRVSSDAVVFGRRGLALGIEPGASDGLKGREEPVSSGASSPAIRTASGAPVMQVKCYHEIVIA
jgi:hypothetical protein